jgi:hypothetical protein
MGGFSSPGSAGNSGGFSPMSWPGLAISLMGQMDQQQQQRKAQQEADEREGQQAALMQQDYLRRERQQRDLLARQQASARARLGALGLGSTGGSGAALLAGMARPALEEMDGDRAALDRRLGVLNDDDRSSRAGRAHSLMSRGMDLLERVKVGQNTWLNQ